MAYEVIISAVSAGVALLLARLITFFKTKRFENRTDKKLDAELEKSETEQALAMYRELIGGLKSDIKGLAEQLISMQAERLVYREENATLKVELRAVKGRVAELEGRIDKPSL